MVRQVTDRVWDAVSDVEFYLERNGERVDDHPTQAILDRPNNVMSGAQMRALLVLYLAFDGEAPVVIMPGDDGELMHCPVPKSWCDVVREKGRDFLDVRFGNAGQAYRYEIGVDAYVLKKIDPQNPYGRGMGLGRAILDEAQTDEFAAKHTKAFFYNSAKPEMLVYMPNADQGELNDAQGRWEDKYRGVSQAYRAAFVGGPEGMIVKELTDRFKDLGMVELRAFFGNLIRQAFGVPPEIIGQLDSSNKATITAAVEIFTRFCINPRCAMLRDELNAKMMPLLPDADGLRICYKSPIPMDREFMLEVMKEAPKPAFLLNDWRELAGWSREPWGEISIADLDKHAIIVDGDVIDVQPLKTYKPKPPPIPLKSANRRLRIVRDKTPDADLSLVLRELQPERIEYPVRAQSELTLLAWMEKELRDQGMVPTDNMLNPAVVEYLNTVGATHIRAINDTTRNQVREALVEGVRAGEGARQLTKRVAALEAFSKARAETIAITEVSTAANYGKYRAYKINPAIEKKRWVATSGARTRPAHRELSGQVRLVDSPFEYGGDQAQYPGGFSNPAMNIRCRCTVVAHFDEDVQQQPLRLRHWVQADRAAIKAFEDEVASDEARMTNTIYRALQDQLTQITDAIARVYPDRQEVAS